LLVGACWHALLNTLRGILKKARCTASSPNNLKLSSSDNRSVLTLQVQKRFQMSGDYAIEPTVGRISMLVGGGKGHAVPRMQTDTQSTPATASTTCATGGWRKSV